MVVSALYFVSTSRQFRTNINIAEYTLLNGRITIWRTVYNCPAGEARNCTVKGWGTWGVGGEVP